jgi:hypothetical protein
MEYTGFQVPDLVLSVILEQHDSASKLVMFRLNAGDAPTFVAHAAR